mgnify:CR=1 FL=1
MINARSLISELQLLAHPEGGFYREMYRSEENIPLSALNGQYQSERSLVTSIYFLLESHDKSRYHRLLSDEFWFYHAGSPVEIFFLNEERGLTSIVLGPLPMAQQVIIPKNTWFAAQPLPAQADFCLVSCIVSPGFHFDDFELADSTKLITTFPAFEAHITAYT